MIYFQVDEIELVCGIVEDRRFLLWSYPCRIEKGSNLFITAQDQLEETIDHD